MKSVLMLASPFAKTHFANVLHSERRKMENEIRMQVAKTNMPTGEEIRIRARALALELQTTGDLPAIMPTDEELKESGLWEKARLELMTTLQKALSDQERYIKDMAEEMGLEVLSKKDLKELYKRVKEAEAQAQDNQRIERPKILLPGQEHLERKPAFLVRANTPELLNESEHQAALEVALARGRFALERAIVTASEKGLMRHFLQYIRDLNMLKTLQWKIRQEKGKRL